MKVIFDPDVEEYLSQLLYILYEKEYFGQKESAYKYIDDLIDDIEHNIQNKLTKRAPDFFNKYGLNMSYAVFKKNDNTQWYVFFNCEDGMFFIRYISNNHVIAQYIE